jgi:hypothetical protein
MKKQKGNTAAAVSFADVKKILDDGMAAWVTGNGRAADLTNHGASFSWSTKAALLAAVGHGKRLIQPDAVPGDGTGVIGNGKGNQANLIIDLRTGIPLRMPRNGPFLSDEHIQRIEDWINAGCPD